MTKGNPTTALVALLRNYHLQSQAASKVAGESDSSPLLPTLLEAISRFLCYPQASVASSPLTRCSRPCSYFTHQRGPSEINSHKCPRPPASCPQPLPPPPPSCAVPPQPDPPLCPGGLPISPAQGQHPGPPPASEVPFCESGKEPSIATADSAPHAHRGTERGGGGGGTQAMMCPGPVPAPKVTSPIVNTSPCLTDSFPSALQQAVIFFHL